MTRLALRDDAGVAEIWLDRPERRNALDHASIDTLEAAVSSVAGDERVRAVVLAGEGPVFCAGADLGTFAALRDSAEAVKAWEERGRAVFTALATLPVPVVCAIQGGAFGGGLELALHTDIRIMGDDAVLQLPEVSRGWLPGWGAMDILPALVSPAVAMQLTLTSAVVQARQALAWGLVSEVAASPLERAREMAASLATADPSVVRMVLAQLRPARRRHGSEAS